jgi:hypothetical protein
MTEQKIKHLFSNALLISALITTIHYFSADRGIHFVDRPGNRLALAQPAQAACNIFEPDSVRRLLDIDFGACRPAMGVANRSGQHAPPFGQQSGSRHFKSSP